MRASEMARFVDSHLPAVVAELASVKGSSPRERGAFMLISNDATLGTIGGGALEYMVIARARQALRDGEVPEGMDIPLGPEIGQCCGGRVGVALRWLTSAEAERLLVRMLHAETKWPHVYLFGSGHVGKALAVALSALPLNVHVVDTRPDELQGLPPSIETKSLPMPEAAVRAAPRGSAFVILTHDHALDFLIAAEALKREDSPYVGMVGSKTKRAKFSSWYRAQGGSEAAADRLVLPIGNLGLVDKRPEVIAVLAAAEIMVHIGQREVPDARPKSELMPGAAFD